MKTDNEKKVLSTKDGSFFMVSEIFKFPIRIIKHWKILVSLLIFTSVAGCRPLISLGKNPAGDDLKRIEKLPNYKDGQFHNLEPAPPGQFRKRVKWTSILKHLFHKPKGTRPKITIPVFVSDLKKGVVQKPTITWFGHSSFLLKTKTATILADPNFSGFAGPFPGMVDAFEGTNFYRIDDLPPIDVLLISHDHYDHLDYTTVMQLKKKVKRIVVPIGVGSHFRHWGFDPATITELQWNEGVSITDHVQIIATPAHHRSNRSFAQKKTLWASYVIKADGHNIYFSGDTGYSKHFKLIGDQYGPFDVSLIECGQYNVNWSQSHLFPWQTARAARDLRSSLLIPVHWAKFAESTHPWNEPVDLLHKSADSLGIAVYTPFIGQPYVVGDDVTPQRWWDTE